jgi:hypothetical protein
MNLYEAQKYTKKKDEEMYRKMANKSNAVMGRENDMKITKKNTCISPEKEYEGFVTMNQPNKEDAVVVLSTGIARKLLHEGYQIMDIKPHKQQKSRTVFVFIREGNIEQRISDLRLLEEKKSFHI